MTPDQLSAALGCPLVRAEKWIDPMNAAMERFEINTPARQAAFIAQIGHESGKLVYVREMWGPTSWQVKYEGRADLGNTQPGDGRRFMGRGLIQITGRANYHSCGAALGEDLESHPELLEQPIYAAMSAGWFWKSHGLNVLADAGKFELLTKHINGGLTGEPDRLALWETAKAALNA